MLRATRSVVPSGPQADLRSARRSSSSKEPKLNLDSLLDAIRAEYALSWNGIHGFAHWMRVRENGLRLAAWTGARIDVVEHFAFLHDAKRLNDSRDPGHGSRAASLVRALQGSVLELEDQPLELLVYACTHHTEGLIEADITVQTCWDADRLDLGRVGITPRTDRLCTPAARDPAVLQWAWERSRQAGEPR
jgi:uncharacterized protein